MDNSRKAGLAAFLSAMLLAGLLSAGQEPPLFRAQTNLVTVPFHVARGGRYASDLRQQDFVLFEDGRTREFTLFEGPSTLQQKPIELMLLFDTTKPTDREGFWSLETTYAFVKQWNETMSRGILQKPNVQVRVSVHHFDVARLQSLCAATADPKEFTAALRRLLAPVAGDGSQALAIPPSRDVVAHYVSHEEYPLEAALSVLKQAKSDGVTRMLVVLSDGTGNTATDPTDVAEQALARGVALYPVTVNYRRFSAFQKTPASTHGTGNYPFVDLQRLEEFRKLAQWTGGTTFDLPSRPEDIVPITADIIRDILESVRDEAASQFLVGFSPTAGSSRAHKLEVKLAPKVKGDILDGKRKVIY